MDPAAALRRFLLDVALDPAVRGHFEAAPAELLDASDLSEAQRAAFLEGGEAALALLGDAVRDEIPLPADPGPPPVGVEVVPLPPVEFTVTLQPFALRHPDGTLAITYSARVHPLGPPPAPSAPDAAPSVSEVALGVLSATPDDRLDRLLDLAEAVEGPWTS